MHQLRERGRIRRRADSLAVGVEQDAGGERADDACQADPLGRIGQAKAERQAEDEQETALACPRGQADDGASAEPAQPDGDPEKYHGPRQNPEHCAHGHAGPPVRRRHGAADERQDDQPQDVVEHGGSQDDLRLPAMGLTEVLQDPGRDPDACRRERSADEDMGERGTLRQQPDREGPPQGEGRHHPDEADQERGGADAHQGTEVYLQTDIEEQDQHTHLGQDLQGRVGPDKGDASANEERGGHIPQEDTDQQFSQHGGLPQPFTDQTGALGRDHEDPQAEENGAKGRMAAPRGSPGGKR